MATGSLRKTSWRPLAITGMIYKDFFTKTLVAIRTVRLTKPAMPLFRPLPYTFRENGSYVNAAGVFLRRF